MRIGWVMYFPAPAAATVTQTTRYGDRSPEPLWLWSSRVRASTAEVNRA